VSAFSRLAISSAFAAGRTVLVGASSPRAKHGVTSAPAQAKTVNAAQTYAFRN
jgi:S1-C subfamily serine protease